MAVSNKKSALSSGGPIESVTSGELEVFRSGTDPLSPPENTSLLGNGAGRSEVLERQAGSEDDQLYKSLRPKSFADYIGQSVVKDNLMIACQAAKQRGDSLDHVLLHGPPGLGKTSLARIIAAEVGVGFKITSGPVIERPGDLAAILTALNERDVLFIDEIHRLSRVVEEVLYSAMEDFRLDIMIGQGQSAKSIRIDLKPFTLVGATTRTSLLTSPLRDRFGVVLRLSYYSQPELKDIVVRSSALLEVQITDKAANEVAKRARGTPRIANRILKRVRDFTQSRVKSSSVIDLDDVLAATALLQIDPLGLDQMDRLILSTVAEKFNGGPVGLNTLSAAISEDRNTIEDVYEPYLIQLGMLQRTARGREVTPLAYQHLGLSGRGMPSGQTEIKFHAPKEG